MSSEPTPCVKCGRVPYIRHESYRNDAKPDSCQVFHECGDVFQETFWFTDADDAILCWNKWNVSRKVDHAPA